MTVYQVTAWCTVPYYTIFEVSAGSPEEALEKAMNQAPNESGEACDGVQCRWDEFKIEDDTGNSLEHLEPSRLAKNAAGELLGALEYFYNIMRDYRSSLRKGYVKLAIERAGQALANAKGDTM